MSLNGYVRRQTKNFCVVAVVDLHRKILDAPIGPIFFIFMQFSGILDRVRFFRGEDIFAVICSTFLTDSFSSFINYRMKDETEVTSFLSVLFIRDLIHSTVNKFKNFYFACPGRPTSG